MTQCSPIIDLDSAHVADLDEALLTISKVLEFPPKTVSHTRNHLRRDAAGFKVLRDIRIPTQDNNYVLGDVYLPLEHGKTYPVLVSCTLYGKRTVYSGPDLENEDEIAAFEKAEDDWHSCSSDVSIYNPNGGPEFDFWNTQRGFENIATFNTFSYVPHGYAMVKIDPRGVSQTPGTRWVPGEITGDFYDAVEWAADQPWSNGKVALVGSSFGANVQWNVASLKPKGLTCFVPYACKITSPVQKKVIRLLTFNLADLDTYREAAYTGGIPAFRYLSNWFERVRKSSPKWSDHMDMLTLMKTQPFYDGLWEMVSSKPDQIELPCFLAASQLFIIHGRGAYEAWRARQRSNTYLQVVDCDYYSWPNREAAQKVIQFLNHYMKGLEYPKLEKVGIQMRLGYNSWYWRKENDWPVPGTQYTKLYLTSDGSVSMEKRPEPEKQLSYSTRIFPDRKSGISFISKPYEEDTELAGHFSAVLAISSSTSDADVVVSLWAVSEEGVAVPYGSKGQPEPIAKGFLRASHRKIDPLKYRPERPWHTHAEGDHAPLGKDEVVRVDVEIFPAAARIRKGWMLRVDITPTEAQPDILGYNPTEMRVWYCESHEEAVNTVHLGGHHENYILCPVVPKSEGYSDHVL